MLDTEQTDQSRLGLNILDVLRSAVLRNDDGCNGVVMPTLQDFSTDSSLHQIRLATTFARYLPDTEAANLVQYSSTLAGYISYDDRRETDWVRHSASSEQFAHEGRFTLIQIQPSTVSIENFSQDDSSNLLLPTVDWVISPNGEVLARGARKPESSFDFSCNAVVSALDVLAEYVTESERNARESRKRFYRRNIFSSAVSKNGHLSFLVPSYRRVCVETAARDQVVHLEVITLAEEHEAPAASTVGQMQVSGEKSWMRMKSSLLNLLLGCSEKVLRFGFIGAGFNFAAAEAL